MILTGGVDKEVLLSSGKFDGKFKASTKMTGHDKKINVAAFHSHDTGALSVPLLMEQ